MRGAVAAVSAPVAEQDDKKCPAQKQQHQTVTKSWIRVNIKLEGST